jgi:sodium/pantothenate symporter
VNGFLDKLSAVDPNLVTPFNEKSPLYRDFFEVVIAQMIVGVAIVCQPHILTRSLFLKHDKDVNKFLTVTIIVQAIFFLVVFAGLYARLHFPGLTTGGKTIPLDGIMPSFVVSRFPVFLAVIIVLGMISAGMSTLEGLIQSLSTTITSDLIKPLGGKRLLKDEKGGWISELLLNRVVIGILGVVAVLLSWQQLVKPDLSVGIFAQNGVYAFFSAAFIPVVFGIFLKHVPKLVPLAASLTAIIVHFSVYYGRLTPYMKEGTRNPGIASAIAILCSIAVGGCLYFLTYKKKHDQAVIHSDAVPAGV